VSEPESMADRPDRRTSPRLAYRFPVSYRTAWAFDALATGSSFFVLDGPTTQSLEGFGENISYRTGHVGGIFIATNNPLPKGAVLELSIRFDDDEAAWTCRGIVRWMRAQLGMGVDFLEPEADLDPKVDEWLQSVASGEKPRSGTLIVPAGDEEAAQSEELGEELSKKVADFISRHPELASEDAAKVLEKVKKALEENKKSEGSG
jgi:hypothetical protein